MERERRGTRIASVRLVATSLISRHIQALPARRGALDQEGVRVVGAVAALLAAALVVAGGLLWRENVRVRPEPSPPAATSHLP